MGQHWKLRDAVGCSGGLPFLIPHKLEALELVLFKTVSFSAWKSGPQISSGASRGERGTTPHRSTVHPGQRTQGRLHRVAGSTKITLSRLMGVCDSHEPGVYMAGWKLQFIFTKFSAEIKSITASQDSRHLIHCGIEGHMSFMEFYFAILILVSSSTLSMLESASRWMRVPGPSSPQFELRRVRSEGRLALLIWGIPSFCLWPWNTVPKLCYWALPGWIKQGAM